MSLRSLTKAIVFSRPFRGFFAAVHRYLRRADLLSQQDRARARYDIHPSVRWEEGTLLLGDGEISIGEHSYLGHNCHLSSHPAGTKIVIGKMCALAHGIHIRTTNFARVPDFREAFDMPPEAADIVIGDFVWIGNNVYICAGVRVGNNSIVGANSVVTRDVAPDTVVGGVPAKLIHHKSTYDASGSRPA
jgi:maltose O-acetyltransferase